ncbi:BREX system Lon protease-like protein BrxL [Candidatus Methanarcanum hacksteinii]|uniref:BREX system Lon protease-like protein BrxL n=1 Tax=Candidatus Methanarcanum hacksteinii TaxID=2911857 RepID=UPI0037DC7545
MYDVQKLRETFPSTTVFKDHALMGMFRTAKIESFLRDWIIKRKAGVDGRINDIDELSRYVATIIPHRNEKERLEDEARSNGETRPFLAKINISFNPKTNQYNFEIPDLGFTYDNTIIEDYVWDRIKEELIGEAGGWGLIKLGYLPPEGVKRGRFTLLEYKNFCPYEINLDAYREARSKYEDTEEWMDVLLGAIDYDASGFESKGMLEQDVWLAKHTMLTRLLPFIQPRINLIELAPQQTGKSYIFGKIDKYGWLAGGGSLSRAKLFMDMRPGAKTRGLVTFADYVAVDEIKSIKFTNDKEMAGILKGYMEDGFVNVGGTRVEGEAGIIFLGNIDVEDMIPGRDMFQDLPEVFRDSALIQRIHGFVPGHNIHPISPDMIMDGWALNTEYFTEIMHLLRSPAESMRYRGLVEELVTVESQGEISNREKEAVMRLCTGYMKLFFPHADSELIKTPKFKMEFTKYCLNPAVAMQQTVLEQMKIINPNEFKNKYMASYYVR